MLGGLLIMAKNTDKRQQIENISQSESWNKTNLLNPKIIGTNEEGKIVKSYQIEIINNGMLYIHYVYEIGDTKTINIPKGKFGTDVIIETK